MSEWTLQGAQGTAEYRLHAVIFHSGQSTNAGHYFAFVRADSSGQSAPMPVRREDDDCHVANDAGRHRPPTKSKRDKVAPNLATVSKATTDAVIGGKGLSPSSLSQPWLRFDDRHVEYQSQADLDALIGGDSSADAYVLFYHRT